MIPRKRRFEPQDVTYEVDWSYTAVPGCGAHWWRINLGDDAKAGSGLVAGHRAAAVARMDRRSPQPPL